MLGKIIMIIGILGGVIIGRKANEIMTERKIKKDLIKSARKHITK